MQARSTLFTLYGDYVRHYGGTIWIGSLIALMAELAFSPSAVRAAVSRMSRQGWLASIRAGRSSYYALSAHGQERTMRPRSGSSSSTRSAGTGGGGS